MAETCAVCDRPVLSGRCANSSHKQPVKVVIGHEYYGCDSGCCGVRWEAVDEHGGTVADEFDFLHALAPGQEYAEKHRIPWELRDGYDENGFLEGCC